jgi:ketosteroid isomerase-like protein
MTALEPAADELVLRQLSARYAAGADRGDGDAYAGVFLPDARMRVYRLPDADTPMTEMAGHEQLAEVPGMLARRYARTFHFVGQCVYEIGDGEATGEVYCQAHHLTTDRHGGTDYVMHMRYQDTYRRNPRGDWKIAARVAFIDWTETRAANPPGT